MTLDQAQPASDLLVQTTSSQFSQTSASAGVSAVPTGSVFDFAGLTSPDGYLLCDGAAISRSTYSSLFAVIGVTYGTGDGATTFNLPDTVGRMTVGQGSAGNAAVQTVGSTEGVSTQANRRPKHQTSLTDPEHSHTIQVQSGGIGLTTGSTHFTMFATDSPVPNVSTNSSSTGISVGTGVSTDSTDTSPYIVFPKIIKT